MSSTPLPARHGADSRRGTHEHRHMEIVCAIKSRSIAVALGHIFPRLGRMLLIAPSRS